jgi:hypothetical protein
VYFAILALAGFGLLVLLSLSGSQRMNLGTDESQVVAKLQDKSPSLGPQTRDEYDVQFKVTLTLPPRISRGESFLVGAETNVAGVSAFRVETKAGNTETRTARELTDEEKNDLTGHIFRRGRLALTLSAAGLTVSPAKAPINPNGKTFWTVRAETKGQYVAVVSFAPPQFDQSQDPDKFYNISFDPSSGTNLNLTVHSEPLSLESLWKYAMAVAGVFMMIPGLVKAYRVVRHWFTPPKRPGPTIIVPGGS